MYKPHLNACRQASCQLRLWTLCVEAAHRLHRPLTTLQRQASLQPRSITSIASPCVQVMRELRWAGMRVLMYDEDPVVQEHALALLRNLSTHSAADVQAVVAWAQGELVPALEDKMDPSSSR